MKYLNNIRSVIDKEKLKRSELHYDLLMIIMLKSPSPTTVHVVYGCPPHSIYMFQPHQTSNHFQWKFRSSFVSILDAKLLFYCWSWNTIGQRKWFNIIIRCWGLWLQLQGIMHFNTKKYMAWILAWSPFAPCHERRSLYLNRPLATFN